MKNGRVSLSSNPSTNFIMYATHPYIFFIRALLIQILWSYLDDMSFLTINTMISMTIPGVAQVIAQVLLNLIYFDILYTEEWLPLFLASLGII